MAFEVMDEHEQGELVQKWLRENALSIVIGVGLGLLLIFGWQQWKTHRAMHQLEAATHYMALTDALEKKNYDVVNQAAQKLRDDYSDTSYAALAAMQQVGVSLSTADKDKDAAYKNMDWAYQHAPAELKELVGTRLARLQISTGKYQEALPLLDGLSKATTYTALVNELRGDAHVGLGHKDEARTAYAEALNGVDAGTPHRNVVEMKLANLGAKAEKQG
ncbi:tetratricopeptide repeat protein [Pseudolysobacter antarcticus]|uniref:Ancillary SecYEG translocon subunit n=1 Tax=Pseudolysobacter antarcticus TaxID=2511995 RepID=A0A411HJS3_9GAMM|nr:tetratricopeptide repeat protein [Pseudolysobacter antarcticus]QBB70650.1 tetratricopeptide repeat protein [Pseudolysobacter antarcticus]